MSINFMNFKIDQTKDNIVKYITHYRQIKFSQPENINETYLISKKILSA